MHWYVRNGISNSAGNPTSFTMVGSPPSCTGSTYICAIYATDNGSGSPIITNSLVEEMIQALENQSNTANVRLKD